MRLIAEIAFKAVVVVLLLLLITAMIAWPLLMSINT